MTDPHAVQKERPASGCPRQIVVENPCSAAQDSFPLRSGRKRERKSRRQVVPIIGDGLPAVAQPERQIETLTYANIILYKTTGFTNGKYNARITLTHTKHVRHAGGK